MQNLCRNKQQIISGIPDERLGEEVGAFIRLKDDSKSLTQNHIRAFCQGSLAHFKVPKYVVIVNDFPRTLSGKIQKYKFTEAFKDELERIIKEK